MASARLGICMLVIASLGLIGSTSTYCQSKQPALAKGNWVNVVLGKEMAGTLSKLDNVEKAEQYRDWIKLAAANALGFNQSANLETFYDFNPLRSDFGRNFSNYSFGEGRSIVGGKDSLYLIIPAASARKQMLLVQLADNFRLISGRMPKAVLVLEYKIDTAAQMASFAYTSDISSADLYSEKYGYVESSVITRADLTAFLSRINDIVFASLQGDILYIGGRKYPGYTGKKIDLEDIAVIYQASNKLYENEISRIRNRGLIDEYDKYVEKNIAYNLLKTPALRQNYSMFELDEQFRQKFTYENYVVEYISFTEKRRDDLNIGFSLDPAVKYNDMYNGLNLILKGDTVLLRKLFKSEIEKDLAESYKGLQARNAMYTAAWAVKEKSMATLMGDSTADKEPAAADKDLTAYLEKMYRTMVLAVRNNKSILLQVAQQLNNQKNGDGLLLYYYLRSYLAGEFMLDIRGPVNDKWNPQKKAIYKKAITDLSETLYNLGYLDRRPTGDYNKQLSDALKLVNEEYFPNQKNFKAIDEKQLNNIISLDVVKEDELTGLDLFVRAIIKPYKYQKARYDGDFKGTKVGMTLFYTDLLMKLWSLNYQNSSPVNVPGFYSETNYRVSVLYDNEIKKNPYTRSWLGPLLSGVEMYNSGKQIYFASTATRIYDASSNDLNPGIEVHSNMSSDRFSNWWNLHYQDVAEVETEYHRLNQIMKWSFLIPWLKTNNRLEWLNQETGMTRNLDFTAWYRDNKTLTVKVDLPFLNRDVLKEPTECIDILDSRPFEMFHESAVRYILSGGVSLGNKKSVLKKMAVTKSPLVAAGRLNRAGLMTFADDAKSFSIAETKYSLNAVKNEALIVPGKGLGFKGRETEFFNLNIERSVKIAGNKLEINQAAGGANPVSIGSVRAERTGNTVQLSVGQNDMGAYQDFFANKDISNYSKILHKKVYVDNSTFIVKLEKTNCVAVVREVKKTDIIMSSSSQPHFTCTDGYMSYDVQFVSDAGMASGSFSNRWFKVKNGAYKVEYVEHTSYPTAKKFFISDGVYHNEARLETDGVYIKQKNFATDESVARSLSSYDAYTIKDALAYEKRVYLINGDRLIRLTKNELSSEDAEAAFIKNMLPAKSAGIKAVIVNPYATDMGFISPGFLEVPDIATLSVERRGMLEFVLQRSSDPDWSAVFKNARHILPEDIKVLRSIHPENYKMASSYYQLKALTNVDERTAVVNLQSVSKKPQVLIKRGSASPETKSLDGSQSIDEAVASAISLYNETSNTDEEVLRRTKPYADLLQQVFDAAGADKIVTMEHGPVNSNVVKQLHNIGRDIEIVKDQPDVAASIGNSNKKIAVHFEKAAILITADPNKDGFKNTKLILDSLQWFGMKQTTNLSSVDFLRILRDSTISQVNLIVRGNQYGLIFSDACLSYLAIQDELPYMYRRKKDFIYIISNVADTLEAIFASYPVFSRIVTGRFTLNDKASLENACLYMKSVYSKAYNEQVVIPAADWKKMEETNTELAPLLGDLVKMERKHVTISTGKMSALKIKSIPSTFWNYIGNKYGSVDKSYIPKNFDKLFKDVQEEKLMYKNKIRKGKLEEFIKTIPGMKAMNKSLKIVSNC